MRCWLLGMTLCINCNILQHTATHCNALQRTATHCNTLQHTATHCKGGGACGVHYSGWPCVHMGRWCEWKIRWNVSHTWLSHVTRTQESRHTCECVMSHMWMRHITHVNASCHTCVFVVSHIWMRHVTRWMCHVMWMCHIARLEYVTHMNEACHSMNESCHILRSHVTLMNGLCPTNERVMSHMWMNHVTVPTRNLYEAGVRLGGKWGASYHT